MFTGIVETIGKIIKIENDLGNKHFMIQSSISNEAYIDQSISHDGVCLTVIEKGDHWHKVTAIEETLKVTNLGQWQEGGLVNLERCMMVNQRLDGHFVQGHVDTFAVCSSIQEANGSWYFTFNVDDKYATLTVNKGSISINGTSLTVIKNDRNNKEISVAIIPYTYNNTNFKNLKVNDIVNIEFDILGKYIQNYLINK